MLLLKCLLRHSRVLVGAGQYTRGPRVTHGTLHARASLNRVGPFRDRWVGYTHSGGWGTRKNDILSTHGTCFWRAAWTPRGNVDREARFGIQIHAWRVEMARRVDAAWKCYRTYWLTLLVYDKINRDFFAQFIKSNFNLCFGKAGPKTDGKRLMFVMDNDPCQTSKKAMLALTQIECELLQIPPRKKCCKRKQ